MRQSEPCQPASGGGSKTPGTTRAPAAVGGGGTGWGGRRCLEGAGPGGEGTERGWALGWRLQCWRWLVRSAWPGTRVGRPGEGDALPARAPGCPGLAQGPSSPSPSAQRAP